ncbi:MAG TPA: RNA degradosome polyphosphate kinase, partial [Actinomycetota bacterium]|nr:RNA degradosome polyphosphate kinase [Actinomycetota bacterium]
MAAIEPGAPARPARPALPRPRRTARPKVTFPYVNRELSWLEFNARVLHEARDERNPLLERVKFLAIFASNLDEFFQVRIAGLRQQVEAGKVARAADGRTPEEQLATARARVLELVADHSSIFVSIRRSLAEEGIELVDYSSIPEHHDSLRQRFLDEIFPVLTPLAVDPGHPFPYISTLSLSIAVGLRDPESGERRFARVKVPQILPRLMEVEPSRFVLLDQVIEANLDALFSGMEVEEHHLFRVTRNADFEIEEDEADDLLLAIEEELRRRRFGAAVRLEVERSMPPATRALLLRGLGLADADCYDISGMLDLTGLWAIADLDRPDLKPVPWSPVIPARLMPPDDDEPADVFAAIRAGDILVHHPYESFAASTERFITQAAEDPDVLTIKQTLYRTSGDSPIVQSLIRAAERGKQVVVLVEIKARFDEEANILWARRLERAGAHVVYGLVGLKTHSKTALVVRREGSGLRRYVHIGTGNYNPKTARQYVDLGLLTCRAEFGADVTDLFNNLTGLSRQRSFRRLLVAPHSLRTRFLDLVEREIGHAAAGEPARIILKLNAIVDVAVIEALYRASNAGVDIDLIVRGACSLQPGLPGVSERIRVRSVIGEFLEHSRIWSFANGGDREFYIGSADLMDRNLDRRVEAVAPVEDHDARERLATVLEVMLADDRRSWQMRPDASWFRTETVDEREGTVDTFEIMKEEALSHGAV